MGQKAVFAVAKFEVKIRGQNHDVCAVLVTIGHQSDGRQQGLDTLIGEQLVETSR